MKKEEVERPVPFDHVFRLFLVLLGPCPQILGARLVRRGAINECSKVLVMHSPRVKGGLQYGPK